MAELSSVGYDCSNFAAAEAQRSPENAPGAVSLPPLRMDFAVASRDKTARPATGSWAGTQTGFIGSKPHWQRSAAASRPWLKDGSNTDRPSTTSRCGALEWLYRQPANDARRQSRWVQSIPRPEQGIRAELRTPLVSARGTPRQIFSARSQTLDGCLTQVRRYRPLEDTLLQAGSRRQERLEELHKLEASPPSSRLMTPMVSQRERQLSPETKSTMIEDLLPPETGQEEPELVNMACCGRGRGACNMVSTPGRVPLAAAPDAIGSATVTEAARATRLSNLTALCQATPLDTSAQIQHIAGFVAAKASSEEERAWMIFCWVCFHITVDCDDFACQSPEHVLSVRVGGAHSISKLFAAVCDKMNLHAKVVSGHIRGVSSLPGDDICADNNNRHWWNGVLLGTDWILVDCACGAVSHSGQDTPQVQIFRPYFFGPAPEDIAFSHYPAESRWQLLAIPLPYDTFVAQVYATPEVFSSNGLEFFPEPRPGGVIKLSKTNTGCVRLRVPPGLQVRASLDGETAHCFVASEGCRRVKLRITVVGATSLRNADIGQSSKYDESDPYCVCHIPGKQKQVLRTEVTMNKCNPKWNQTFDVDDLEPGDELRFRIFDKDFGTQDDLLGEVTLTTGDFFSGGDFEGELALINDGGSRARLQLRIQPLHVQEVQPLALQDRPISDVYFRTPNGPGEHHLEIFTYQPGPSRDTFRRVCVFKILIDANPPDFADPFFPEVSKGGFHLYGIAFPEALPKGRYVLGAKNELELSLIKTAAAPPGLQVLADIDGDRNAALAHVSGDKVVIRAQPPPGDHMLNVLMRRDPKKQFGRIAAYRLHVPEDCAEVLVEGFAQVQDAYHEMNAVLEAPLTGCLQPGLHRFRLRLPLEFSDAKVSVLVSGSRESISIARHHDGTFEGDARLVAPEATILCGSSEGAMRPLLRWTVANRPTAAPPLPAARPTASPPVPAARSTSRPDSKAET